MRPLPLVNESSLTRESKARKEIRLEYNDVYNRLQSIVEDAAFISRIAHSYPTLKIYPNLRCGAWYVEPKLCEKEPVYFKSTDGHFGQWAFNLRRANLHLLDAAKDSGGLILVDSTRRGKRFPDALSKTIPTWCAVINLAVMKLSKETPWVVAAFQENAVLHTPPTSVSRSEHAQIESRLEGWAEQLLSSEFSIPRLPKPLRPIWITASTQTLPSLDSLDFFPIVCVSASKLVHEGIERRSTGFTYVQGSGDDHESWSQGLTPDIFWKNKAQILSASRSTLSSLISSLVDCSISRNDQSNATALVPVARVQCRLWVGPAQSLPSGVLPDRQAYVLITSQPLPSPPLSTPSILFLQVAAGKKGQYKFLTQVLPQALHFVRHRLTLGDDVAVLCDDGKNISVGVAVAALSLFFDDEGACIANAEAETLTKKSIQRRLQWILADNTEANPSRTTLKRVNEYLMSQPRHLDTTSGTIQQDLKPGFDA